MLPKMGMTPSRKRYQQIPTNNPNQYNLTINDDTTQMGYAHGMCVAEMPARSMPARSMPDTYMPAHSSPHNTYHHRTTTNKQRIQHYHADGCQV